MFNIQPEEAVCEKDEEFAVSYWFSGEFKRERCSGTDSIPEPLDVSR